MRTRSLLFRENDYLALLITLLTSLEQNAVNMLVCLRSWLSDDINF